MVLFVKKKKAAGGAPTQVIDDGFTDLTGLDLVETGWTLDGVNDEVDHSGGSNFENLVALFSTTTASDAWIACKIVSKPGASKSYGFVMRGQASDSKTNLGDHYDVVINDDDLRLESLTGNTFNDRVGSTVLAAEPGNGDYIGLRITGTGTGTQLEYWDFGTTAPDSNPNNWGTATDTVDWGENETGVDVADAVDSGTIVGLRAYNSTDPTEVVTYDDFEAWTP